jgi:hypothetical protein
MAITKWPIPVEAISASLGMSQAFATSSPPSRSAGALLHPAEDIGSALKGGVNVCQRQPVNEVFGPLVTKFVRNFGREGATPIQRGSNASLLGRVQAVELIRHNVPSQRMPVDGSVYQARSRCCLASTNGTELRVLGCCKPVPHPLQRMPEKHLARQGIFGFLCGLETVLGVVLAQLDL